MSEIQASGELASQGIEAQGAPTGGGRGPSDDFFCHKYSVWYRVEDCVYRGTNKTYAGCIDCFQGRLNMRSVEKGVQPPAFLVPAPPVRQEPNRPSGHGRRRTLR